MATLFADAAFNINQIDLNWYVRNFFDATFSNNANIPFHGIVYTDVYDVDGIGGGDDLTLSFGGPNITVNNNLEVTGGTVTGILEFDNSTNSVLWGIEGISVSAVAIYNAAFTLSNSDELGLARQALSGDDTFQLSPFADTVNGFNGNDLIRGNGGNDLLLGGSHNDFIYGDAGNDELRGGNGHDRLFGGNNNDLLIGGNGQDRLFGGSGDDLQRGGNGADILLGNSGRDKLVGNGANDQLEGGSENDVLIGGAGNDTIDGGTGNDRLKGFTDADVFVFADGYDKDKIKDFEDGIDKIDLSDFNFANAAAAKGFASNVSGDVVFNFGGGDKLIVENIATGALSGLDFIL